MNAHTFNRVAFSMATILVSGFAAADDGGPPPCTIPLPACAADIAPPGGDGTANVQDLLAVINTFGQNGVPTNERPQGDCAPLPNGDCVVDVLDLLAVINVWGVCAAGVADHCIDAIDITHNLGGFRYGTNVSATPTNAPDPEVPAESPTCHWAGQPSEVRRTVWYKFTAPAGEGVIVETCSSQPPFVDSVIAVYAGTCGSLTEVACDDETCPGEQTHYARVVATNLTPGETFFIMVANAFGWGGAQPGPFTVRFANYFSCQWQCPPNSIEEGEPCMGAGELDTWNGGCNSTPTVYSTNLTINGPPVCDRSSTGTGGFPPIDADWYHFVPTATSTYRIQLNAEFPATTGIVTGVGTIGGPCSNPIFAPPSVTHTVGNCEEVISQPVMLTAGVNHAVVVRARFSSGYPCSSGLNDYWVRLISP